MALQAPTGTPDLLPEAARKWLVVKRHADEVFSLYGYLPVETPTFEYLDVFTHGIGEATDVVGKEMFHVYSQQSVEALKGGGELKAKDTLALRPEGTAGVTRAVAQHNLVPAGGAALKLYYSGPMFRYERPQKGRLREFRQIGAELLGAAEPSADAEVIEMLMRFYTELGIPAEMMLLKLNSMGDDACRPAYRELLRDFIVAHPGLCPDCLRRADTNPLRALDCKNDACQAILSDAPRITDALCPDCQAHYATVKQLLDAQGIAYSEDHRLVRGLDYYTRTVFEVQATSGLGSQNAIGGGGRYDKLIEVMGGKPTPGLGFAIGFERVALVLDEVLDSWAALPPLEVYVAAVDDSCRAAAFAIATELRDANRSVELDHQGRSLKSQLKAADKSQAALTVIVGPDELAAGQVTLRDMNAGTEQQIALKDLAMVVEELAIEALIEGYLDDISDFDDIDLDMPF